MMKTVNYFGRKYWVPDWTRFMATDQDGMIYAFNTQPSPIKDNDFRGVYWGVLGVGIGRCERVGRRSINWSDSLVEL